IAALGSGAWTQALQMSFTRQRVFCAMDNNLSTVGWFDRTELAFKIAANYHMNTAIPASGGAASTKSYSPTAFYGAVDPASGIYYCGTPTSASLLSGIWFMAYPGARVEMMVGSLATACGEFF